jgi:hypothetical protein
MIGLGTWSGLGTFSLEISHLPHFARPDLAEFGWAIVIGLAAAIFGTGVRRLALAVRPYVRPRLVLAMPLIGLFVADLAVAFSQLTGKSNAEVLFSGQNQVSPLVQHAASYTAGALVLLLACRALATPCQ